MALEQLGQPARSLCGLRSPEPRARQRGGGDAGARAGVGGTGKSAQPGEERMAVPQKAVRRQFLFLQSQLPLFKRAGLVQARTAPLILLNWLPREGSGKGS